MGRPQLRADLSGHPPEDPRSAHESLTDRASIVLARLVIHLRGRWDRRSLLSMIGLLALGVFVARTVGESRRLTADLGPTEPVIVATRDLRPGQVVSSDQIAVIHWPRGLVPPGSTGSGVEVLGQVVRSAIAEGEAISMFRLGAGNFGLAPDQRALTLPLPLAPPPVAVGDPVALFGVGVTGGIDVSPDTSPFATVEAVQITSGQVVALDDAGITVAIDAPAVRSVLEHLATGTVEVIVLP